MKTKIKNISVALAMIALGTSAFAMESYQRQAVRAWGPNENTIFNMTNADWGEHGGEYNLNGWVNIYLQGVTESEQPTAIGEELSPWTVPSHKTEWHTCWGGQSVMHCAPSFDFVFTWSYDFHYLNEGIVPISYDEPFVLVRAVGNYPGDGPPFDMTWKILKPSSGVPGATTNRCNIVRFSLNLTFADGVLVDTNGIRHWVPLENQNPSFGVSSWEDGWATYYEYPWEDTLRGIWAGLFPSLWVKFQGDPDTEYSVYASDDPFGSYSVIGSVTTDETGYGRLQDTAATGNTWAWSTSGRRRGNG
jgi:hypothetical protein